ncbi:MAG: hypothetical protein P8N02_01045, partial [Actinomycetota bacterium]|nr:hypothetical protein [Actinomycetota bacterium]
MSARESSTDREAHPLERARLTVRQWCEANLWWCLTAAVVVATASVWCLTVAVGQSSLPSGLVWTGVGGFFGALALLLSNEIFHKVMASDGRRGLGAAVGIGGVAVGA